MLCVEGRSEDINTLQSVPSQKYARTAWTDHNVCLLTLLLNSNYGDQMHVTESL